jgi:hypothetical protein
MPWIALSLLSLGALVVATELETRRLEARFPPVGRIFQPRHRQIGG